MRFVECDTCRVKPGTPALCHGCLANRQYIHDLEQELKGLYEGSESTTAKIENLESERDLLAKYIGRLVLDSLTALPESD